MTTSDRDRRRRRRTRARRLAFASSLLVVLGFEGALRLAVEPSAVSSGRLFGAELPPVRPLPPGPIPVEAPALAAFDEPFRDLVVDGVRVTHGDLWGIMREDPRLGHAPRESVRSTNGWFVTNALGALAESETAPRADGPRVLVFGSSFAQCSRVPIRDSWPYALDRALDGVEVVNFGVDGYSMAQALLRYRTLVGRVEHDVVVVACAPEFDLWRDVNVARFLADGWRSFRINPRFELCEDVLVEVPPPYATQAAMAAANGEAVSATLREHLRRHDAFYLPAVHDGGWWDGPVLGRLFALAFASKPRRIKRRLCEPDSVATVLVRRIFESFACEARAAGAELHVVSLPSRRTVDKPAGADERIGHAATTAFLGSGRGYACHDLLDDLEAAAPLDAGYDGTHYGPRANRAVAAALARRLDFAARGPRPAGR